MTSGLSAGRNVDAVSSMKVSRHGFFLRQGALILLPVIVLLAAGLWSLWRDRMSADREARDRAQKLASTAAIIVRSEFATLDDNFGAIVAASRPLLRATNRVAAEWRALSRSTENSAAKSLLSFFAVDAGGTLLYPPETLPLTPRPVAAKFPSDEQREKGTQAQRTGVLEETVEPRPSLEAPLEAGVPSRERLWRIRFARAVSLKKERRAGAAWTEFIEILFGAGDIYSDAGLPLRQLAALHSLDLWPVAGTNGSNTFDRARLVKSIGEEALDRPTLFSPVLLNRLISAATSDKQRDAAGTFQERWEREEALRSTAESILSASHSATRPGGWREGDFWVARAAGEPQAELFCVLDLESLIKQVSSAVHRQTSFEDDFAVVLGWPGSEPLANKDTLAQIDDLRLPGSSNMPNASITVFLEHPRRFYARQRQRAILFGSLLGVAAIVAFVGFLNARRAFERERHLNSLKSDFVSSVSHELRAPIASVRLMAESLDRGTVTEPSKRNEYYRFIVQECRRLGTLIENVLDFSRIEQNRKQYDFEPVDLPALVIETAKLTSSYGFERGVPIKVVEAGESAWPLSLQLQADSQALQQALINLIDNALKHSPAGAEVKVGWEISEPESASPRVALWVEDRGPGIPASEHRKIFERFYRIGSEMRRDTQGVGIGLSIVKHIVDAHGGRVEVRSAPGSGSRFTLLLPLKKTVEGETHVQV